METKKILLKFILLICFVPMIVTAEDQTANDQVIIYTLNPSNVWHPLEFTRIDFFEGWYSDGMHGKIIDDQYQIDSLISYINSCEIIDTLAYNVYSPGIASEIRTPKGEKLYIYTSPAPRAAIIIKKADKSDQELIWVTTKGFECGYVRRKINQQFFMWLYDVSRKKIGDSVQSPKKQQ